MVNELFSLIIAAPTGQFSKALYKQQFFLRFFAGSYESGGSVLHEPPLAIEF
jgi:hypothetical protein